MDSLIWETASPRTHKRKIVNESLVASSRKSQTKVGTLACFDFCKRMSKLCKNPAMLFHVDMMLKKLCFSMRTVTKSNPEQDFFSFMSKRRKYADVLPV